MNTKLLASLLFALAVGFFDAPSQAAAPNPTPADAALSEYFRSETAKLSERCLIDIKTLADWTSRRPQYHQQLLEMLGLWPTPTRGDLKATVTGRTEHDLFTVEKLHFQSLPGLYVTANLYLPKGPTSSAPAILYLCGHGPVITNGISYGNKVAYQHHGAWFARHGYVCLLIDTLQLGEIQGLHHGTYREGMWWWNSRGYTPAGVEAWNGIRALDYLCTRSEVDPSRIGVTGRSGGGSYSWTVAALDERVKVAAPVAGITDLQNHVVDGAVEGHCDCMFTVNTYRWDYPQLAALVAPRPLLFVNSDADGIFPLDGVERTHMALRRIYELYGAKDKLGLVIGPGPHKDTQDLQMPVFRWFNKHLQGNDPIIEKAATKFFSAQQLKVFTKLPADAINANIHETFIPSPAPPRAPDSRQAWDQQRTGWLAALTNQVFRGWPEARPALHLEQKFSGEWQGVRLRAFGFTSQEHVPLTLYEMRSGTGRPGRIVLHVIDKTNEISKRTWLHDLSDKVAAELTAELLALRSPAENSGEVDKLAKRLQTEKLAVIYFSPRGAGLSAWSGSERVQAHLRRRFMLLGQTVDGMRVWDIRRAVEAVRSVEDLQEAPLELNGRGAMACDVLFASIFESGIQRLDLGGMPASLRDGPDFLNVLRFLDLPQAVAMAAEQCPVQLHESDPTADRWRYPASVARLLNWPAQQFTFANGH